MSMSGISLRSGRCVPPPGQLPVDEYPIRSPLALADFLSRRVVNKTYLEVGTQGGDVLNCISRYARRVVSIEMQKDRCAQLRAKGLPVICSSLEKADSRELAVADVIFLWVDKRDGVGESVARANPIKEDPPSSTLQP